MATSETTVVIPCKECGEPTKPRRVRVKRGKPATMKVTCGVCVQQLCANPNQKRDP